jgi:hypothetical protein
MQINLTTIENISRSVSDVRDRIGFSESILNFFNITGGGDSLIASSGGDILIGETISNILQLIFFLVVIISLAMAIYGGFLYTSASDDEERLEQAQNTIKNAVIGLLIGFLSLLIVNFVSTAVGFRPDSDFDDLSEPSPGDPVPVLDSGTTLDDFFD